MSMSEYSEKMSVLPAISSGDGWRVVKNDAPISWRNDRQPAEVTQDREQNECIGADSQLDSDESIDASSLIDVLAGQQRTSAYAGEKEEEDRAKDIDRAVQQNSEDAVPDNFISQRDEARQT